MLFEASAPGSLMLMGEYAVLHGKHALVCAVDKRMTVTLEPRQDKQIKIHSALGEYVTELSRLDAVAPFQFVLATLKKFKKKLQYGCQIRIASQFSHQVGFASSAAVTVATLATLNAWLKLDLSKAQMVQHARAIVREVQGLGSGADVAACVLGGVVFYRAKPFHIEKLPNIFPLSVIYSGSKTPTVEAVTRVNQAFASHPALFRQICQAIEQCVIDGKKAISAQDWLAFGNIMNIQQGLMDALGVNTSILAHLINELRQQKTIFGAKISGSGLGDCVIGLGKITELQEGEQIQVAISEQGVMCEEK